MTLRPDDTIQKALISTPSQLAGEFESSDLLLTHAWPEFGDRAAFGRRLEGPASRSTFVFAFRTPTIPRVPGVLIPDYSYLSERIAGYLAVLFGKRFDLHGLLEGSGFFHIPNLLEFNYLCHHHLPFNSFKSRPDYAIPLNLGEFNRIAPLLFNHEIDYRFRQTFDTCCKFYLQALHNAERNPEVAYLHLITVGEILSNLYDYPKADLLSDRVKEIFYTIEHRLEGGARLVRELSGNLRQIKKRFSKTLETLIDDAFFNQSEASDSLFAFKSGDFMQRMNSAYDLRSQYVHSGIPFGGWVSQQVGGNNEIPPGPPSGIEADLRKILSMAPTLVGLERVMRYALLQCAQAHGIPIATPANDTNQVTSSNSADTDGNQEQSTG